MTLSLAVRPPQDVSQGEIERYAADLQAQLREWSVAPHSVTDGEWFAAVRRMLTKDDPLAFAMVYLNHHLIAKETGGGITLGEIHLEWVQRAKDWTRTLTEPYESRHSEVGPRGVGKSTFWFLLLPMWAAAHGHVKFVAAFSETTDQAEKHLASFKDELDTNALLRGDFPALCSPKTRGRGTVAADRVSLYHSQSGFVFGAQGVDSSALGMKVGKLRPDLIIMDDIEPDEAKYSATLADKRLKTLIDAIMPLNIYARVVVVGTVTMDGSIIHQTVQAALGRAPQTAPSGGKRDNEDWIKDSKFQCHYFPAIVEAEDGTRRSIWPAKWSLAFLESIEGTRDYLKNYANDPLGANGDYWTADTFDRSPLDAVIVRRVLSLDPNVTQKASSDFAGIAVVGWTGRQDNRCLVEHAAQVKLSGEALRLHILALVEEFNVGLVLVETNQGGDLWKLILWGLPVKIKDIHQDTKKEVRAANVLLHYERHRVHHVRGLGQLEGQMVSFPRAPHDDMVDAVGTGVSYFLNPRKTTAAGTSQISYA